LTSVAFTHGIRRLSNGRFRVRLSARERELLRSISPQLRPIVAGEDDVADASTRLFPRAYDNMEMEMEYRDLVGTSIADVRVAALDAFAETLDLGTTSRLGWSVSLDADQASAWLSAINDCRLVLGTVTGVDDEGKWDEGPDDDDPNSVALFYLGWLQEELVAALAQELPE
jgi:hypothetical protein